MLRLSNGRCKDNWIALGLLGITAVPQFLLEIVFVGIVDDIALPY